MRSRLVLAAVLALFPILAAASEPGSRTFEAVYTAKITNIPANAGLLKVWIPLPASRVEQSVSDVVIDSPYDWKRATEAEFGDDYAFASIPAPPTGELTIRVRFRATRHGVEMAHIADVTPGRSELQRALRADRMVTISPRIQQLAAEITRGKTTTMDKAHAIYEYVVSTMKYDKTIPGWGHGDTERACDIHAGNCTDFHSLFMSLARASSIPARFTIGFPLPKEPNGTITGYHCWAEFYVKGRGWIPVDASEASKSSDEAVRAAYFGNLGADRIAFTMGRDLTLSPPTSEPVNFLIYPRVEADGKEVGSASLSLEVHDVKQGATPVAGATQ